MSEQKNSSKNQGFCVNKKMFLLIFAITFSVFLFTSDGHRFTMDEDQTQMYTKRLVTLEPHPLFVQGESRMLFEYPDWYTNPSGPICKNPILCSPSYIGHAILYYPFVYLNYQINAVSNTEINYSHEDFNDPAYIIWRNSLDNDFLLLETLFGPIFSSLSVSIFFLVCRTFGYSEKISLILSFVFGFGTVIWAYSNTSLNTVPALFFILLGYFYFRLFEKTQSVQKLALSSISLGFGFLVRPDAILVIIPLFVMLMYNLKNQKKKFLKIIAVLVPYVIAFGTTKIIEYLNFGEQGSSDITSGIISSAEIIQTPLHVGIFGNLLSPGLGIMVFVPVLFTIFFSYPDFWNKYKKETILFSSIIITFLVFYGRLDAWHGLVSWSARYMVLLIPFLLLPLGYSIQKRNNKKLVGMILILSGIGAFFNVIYVIQDVGWFVWCTPGCAHGLYTLVDSKLEYNIAQSVIWTFKNSQLIWAIDSAFTNLQIDLIFHKMLGGIAYTIIVASTILVLSITIAKILKKSTVNEIQKENF